MACFSLKMKHSGQPETRRISLRCWNTPISRPLCDPFAVSAEILREAAKAGDVTIVQVEGRSHAAVLRTLLHERFHLFQNRLPEGPANAEIRGRFLANELAAIGAQLIGEHVSKRPEEVWYEVPTSIAAGQGESLGYTRDGGGFRALSGRTWLQQVMQHAGDVVTDIAQRRDFSPKRYYGRSTGLRDRWRSSLVWKRRKRRQRRKRLY